MPPPSAGLPVLPNVLPYRKPKEGRDYWVADNFLPNAAEVSERCFSRTDWTLGAPMRPETWPGMRAAQALLPDELKRVEDWVKKETAAKELGQRSSPDGGALSYNYVQLVGERDSGPRPHVDSLKLCNLAGVLYLTPSPPKGLGGTAFYRLRHPNNVVGGNIVPPPHANLVDALGVRKMPLEVWEKDVEVENRFNRLFIYKSDMVHSAASYFGREHREKRMTALFFWMARY